MYSVAQLNSCIIYYCHDCTVHALVIIQPVDCAMTGAHREPFFVTLSSQICSETQLEFESLPVTFRN